MKKVSLVLALAFVATPAFAQKAIPAEELIPQLEKQVSECQDKESQLQAQLDRANAIIGALSRQRNEAMDRAVLLETRAAAAEAAAKKGEEPKK